MSDSTKWSDVNLLEAFENGTFPRDQWNQRAHVAVAYLFLCAHPFDDALDRLRSDIRSYNAANGIADSPTTGYNETTTVALVRIIDAVRRAYAEVFPAASAMEFCDLHPELMSKHILRLFYSPERRMDPRAKTTFLEPDLASLPEYQAPDRSR